MLFKKGGVVMCNAENHHPSCACGFGGVGHKGISPGGWQNTRGSAISNAYHSTANGGFRWNYYDEDWCIPVICRRCGASVFLVHYNGGYASFDALGKPWQKHPCYDNSGKYGANNTPLLYQQLIYQSANLTFPVLATVIQCHKEAGKVDIEVMLRCENSTIVTAFISGNVNLRRLIGELVLFSKIDKKIVLVTIAETYPLSFEPSLPFLVGKIYKHDLHGNVEVLKVTKVGDKFGVDIKFQNGEIRKILISESGMKPFNEPRRYWWEV